MFDFVNIRIEKNSLMLITTVIYILGICSGFTGHYYILGLLVSALLGIFAKYNVTKLKYLFAWILIFYFGIFSALFRVSETDDLFSIAPVDAEISGKIVSIPSSNSEDKCKFFFKVDSLTAVNKKYENLDAKVLVNLQLENNSEILERLNISNRYMLKGSLRRPFKPSNPSQFDYGRYLRNFGAHTVFYANAGSLEELPSKLDLSEKLVQGINSVRHQIIDIHSRTLKTPYLELLGGIVFGDDAVAPPDYIKDSFINSGLLHILAASGMNVAFIYGFWFIIAGWLRIPFKVRIIAGIPLILLYALMTGLGASVVRAAIMIIFVLIGKLIDRDSNSISLLAFVAFLMLLINPSYINDVGFQLSFVVTLGILLMSPLIITFGDGEKPLPLKYKLMNSINGVVFIPVIAQIWVMPIQMFYFNTISTYSVFANILTVPFLSVVSFGGFISSILAPLGVIGAFVCKLFDIFLNPFLQGIVAVSDYFSSIPNSLIITEHPGLFQVLLYYILLVSITFCLVKRVFDKRYLTAIALGVFVLMFSFIQIPNNKAEVIFFDVQNADCILLKSPKNEYFMIDTGKAGYNGGKTQAEFIVEKYLKDKGIKRLNSIIVTHFDNDHAGGAIPLMDYGTPERIYLNSDKADTQTSYQIFKYLKTHTEVKPCYPQNAEIIYSEPNFRVINYRADYKGDNSDNENSLVTLVEAYDKKLLFTGDAGEVALTKLRQDLPSDLDLLKVPHHGARGVLNKDLLDKFSPKYSVISVGKNVYGHPSRETLDLLANFKVLRTDVNNSIKISVDKKGLNVLNYDLKKKKFTLVSCK